MATHTMNINAVSFRLIEQGQKTLEVRLLKDGVEGYAKGDILEVRNRDTGQTVSRDIPAIHPYESLDDLIANEDLSLGGAPTDPISFKARMRGFQTEDDERQFGLAAIHLSKA